MKTIRIVGTRLLPMKPNPKASGTPKHHRELEVWEIAMDLTAEVYRVTRRVPASERFGLTQQMRSAAVSIAANIAEGKGRTQPRDYARCIGIARGSAYELDTYIALTQRLEYLRAEDLASSEKLLGSVSRMLTALLRRLTPLPRSTQRTI
jgi:four helix bundle protein